AVGVELERLDAERRRLAGVDADARELYVLVVRRIGVEGADGAERLGDELAGAPPPRVLALEGGGGGGAGGREAREGRGGRRGEGGGGVGEGGEGGGGMIPTAMARPYAVPAMRSMVQTDGMSAEVLHDPARQRRGGLGVLHYPVEERRLVDETARDRWEAG